MILYHQSNFLTHFKFANFAQITNSQLLYSCPCTYILIRLSYLTISFIRIVQCYTPSARRYNGQQSVHYYYLHGTSLIYAGFTDQITYITLLVALANYILLSKVYQ